MTWRYEIATKRADPKRPWPNKFRPVVKRWRLARMLLREAWQTRFNLRLLLSRPCIYGVFSGPLGGFWPLRRKCVGCMRCVQEYPDICRVFIEEGYRRLGDSYFEPDAVGTLDLEATTGEIPVRGVGYKGAFSGPGFDSIWTDMSEIVRPTRDGIYGREYISTSVDIGRKPDYLPLRERGSEPKAPIVEVPLPFLFEEPPEDWDAAPLRRAIGMAAQRLGTFFISRTVPREEALFSHWIPRVSLRRLPLDFPSSVSMWELDLVEAGELAEADGRRFLEPSAGRLCVVRLPLRRGILGKILELFSFGFGAFHLAADYHGREWGLGAQGRFVTEVLLELHQGLVERGIRDQVTLAVSGGIVRAEHLPKALLCGADLAVLNTPLWVATGAEFRGECVSPESSAPRFTRLDLQWGCQRIVNFCAAWRNQLVEIMSAMGIRDVRRLRGERGRALFFEELEKEAFSWMRS